MFLVIAKKHHDKKFAPLGGMWMHTTAETAVKHAQDRARFGAETYLVVHDGKIIFTTTI